LSSVTDSFDTRSSILVGSRTIITLVEIFSSELRMSASGEPGEKGTTRNNLHPKKKPRATKTVPAKIFASKSSARNLIA
jgi:hypothetical protein